MALGATGWLGSVDEAYAVDPQLCLELDIGDAYCDGVNGADDDFWTDFDSVMSTHLGSYYGDWTAAAALWSLDR